MTNRAHGLCSVVFVVLDHSRTTEQHEAEAEGHPVPNPHQARLEFEGPAQRWYPEVEGAHQQQRKDGEAACGLTTRRSHAARSAHRFM